MNYTAAQLTSLKFQKGFTLIELMVVVAIIAILAVIGITIFSGAQRGARDATRRSDVNTIIKTIETKKGSAANYGGLTFVAGDFTTGALPADPSTSTQIYCASPTGTATTPTDAPGAAWGTTCPTGYVTVNGTAYTAPANTTQIRICAQLEDGSTPFCRVTAQ